jgi:hypothetical protein
MYSWTNGKKHNQVKVGVQGLKFGFVNQNYIGFYLSSIFVFFSYDSTSSV